MRISFQCPAGFVRQGRKAMAAADTVLSQGWGQPGNTPRASPIFSVLPAVRGHPRFRRGLSGTKRQPLTRPPVAVPDRSAFAALAASVAVPGRSAFAALAAPAPAPGRSAFAALVAPAPAPGRSAGVTLAAPAPVPAPSAGACSVPF